MTESGAAQDGLVTEEPAASVPRAPDTVVDGRNARRDRNRNAVLDAAIGLFAEGNLQPSPAEIAHRSGVSHRSINRYFPDTRSLLRAAVDRQIEVGVPLYLIHAIGRGPLGHRIDEFVRVRLAGYEVLGATARAANLLSTSSRIVRSELGAVRGLLTEQVERQFAAELEALDGELRTARLLAIDALFQFETLDFYCRLVGLGLPEAHRILSLTLAGLLDPGPGRDLDA